MALKAGTIADFSDSMAEAIENAFLEEWPEAMGGADKPETNPQMRLLFVAVAQGVVRYLTDHAEAAFRIHSVEVTQDESLVESTGTGFFGFQVTVTQNASDPGSSDPANPVISKGDGKLEILTTGTLHP